jgi:hypothetical protein
LNKLNLMTSLKQTMKNIDFNSYVLYLVLHFDANAKLNSRQFEYIA